MSIKKRGKSYAVRWRRDGVQHSRSFVRKEDAEAFELEQKRTRQLGAHALAAPSRETLLISAGWSELGGRTIEGRLG